MKVLVATEHSADDRKTLAATRALARAGAQEVAVGSDSRWNPPLWSRYCHHRVYYPSPVHAPEAFHHWLVDHALEQKYDVILPLSDYTTFALSSCRDDLADSTGTAVPPLGALEQAHDKLATLRLAQTLGLEIPETLAPGSREEVIGIGETLTYPCAFKPRRGAGAIGLAFPDSADALLACYDQPPLTAEDHVMSSEDPLIQEYIPGHIHDACLLFDHGTPVASFTQKRLWMWPASGGVGIYNETTREPELLEQATTLLRAMQWHGPAMVEFKLDSRDGRYKLMEVNSRFWGTLGASVAAGVNFPWLTCLLAAGRMVKLHHDYHVGMRYWWPLPYGWRYLRAQSGVLQSTAATLQKMRSTRNDLRLTDPLPHLVDGLSRFLMR